MNNPVKPSSGTADSADTKKISEWWALWQLSLILKEIAQKSQLDKTEGIKK